MTVAELGARMSWSEFMEWLAYFRLRMEPEAVQGDELLRKVEMLNTALGGTDKRRGDG